MTTPEQPESKISTTEQSQIKEYILKHHTAMLTVMFTDIENYTSLTERKGDAYVAELRQHHDAIIKNIIEHEESGLVIKFIGDAVMAVFSEPTVAVERSMEIQSSIREFNESHDEFEDIAVRIGMHVGQIAIEDEVQMDIFGRHVNRAARVESLADGGQVLVTYPVWDSAKGWLDRAKDIQCEAHGRYELKGIPEPIDIYEVYQPNHTQPKAPAKGKIKETHYASWGVAAALALIVVLLLFLSLPGKPDLWLDTEVKSPLYLDGNLISFGEPDQDGFRPVLEEIVDGEFQLSYHVSPQLGYIANVSVGNGQQRVSPLFEEIRLPSLKTRLSEDENSTRKRRDFSATDFSGQVYNGSWNVVLKSEVVESEVRFTVDWRVAVDTPEAINWSGQQILQVPADQGIESFEGIELATNNGLTLWLKGFTSKQLLDTALSWEFSVHE